MKTLSVVIAAIVLFIMYAVLIWQPAYEAKKNAAGKVALEKCTPYSNAGSTAWGNCVLETFNNEMSK